MRLSKSRIQSFQNEILAWYAVNKRDLPWRQDRDPYHILLSELMLQQTQVSRVIPKYKQWLAAFPSLEALANAPVRDVLRLWSGLGYNRRAVYLHQAASTIVTQLNYAWPRTPSELEKLPGIGKYTAAAVACFAFDEQIPVVDTNIRKVISVTFFAGQVPAEATIASVAKALVPHGQAYDWNQALMDYAATVLKKERIPVPKQSRFVGSNRYYRGKLLRLLLRDEKIAVSVLGQTLKEDFSEEQSSWLSDLILGMVKDKLIEQKNGFVLLSSEKLH
jgi:A/G-specific adenine glycosylase